MKNYKPTVWGLQEIHFEFKDASGLKLKKWKKLPAKTNQNKVRNWVAILISDNADNEDFRINNITKDKKKIN